MARITCLNDSNITNVKKSVQSGNSYKDRTKFINVRGEETDGSNIRTELDKFSKESYLDLKQKGELSGKIRRTAVNNEYANIIISFTKKEFESIADKNDVIFIMNPEKRKKLEKAIIDTFAIENDGSRRNILISDFHTDTENPHIQFKVHRFAVNLENRTVSSALRTDSSYITKIAEKFNQNQNIVTINEMFKNAHDLKKNVKDWNISSETIEKVENIEKDLKSDIFQSSEQKEQKEQKQEHFIITEPKLTKTTIIGENYFKQHGMLDNGITKESYSNMTDAEKAGLKAPDFFEPEQKEPEPEQKEQKPEPEQTEQTEQTEQPEQPEPEQTEQPEQPEPEQTEIKSISTAEKTAQLTIFEKQTQENERKAKQLLEQNRNISLAMNALQRDEKQQEKITSLSSDFEAQKTENIQQIKINDIQKSELFEKDIKLENKSEKIREISNELEDKKIEIFETSFEIDGKNNKINKLSENLANVQQDFEIFKSEANQKIVEVSAELENSKNQVVELEQKNASLSENLEQMSAKIDEQKNTIQEISTQAEQEKQQFEDFRKDFQSFKEFYAEKIEAIKKENETLKEENQNLKLDVAEIEELREEVSEFEKAELAQFDREHSIKNGKNEEQER